MHLLVVGIDPAPSGKPTKGNAVVEITQDATSYRIQLRPRVTHPELRRNLMDWKSLPSVLLAWDAPLTGPMDPDCSEAGFPRDVRHADFTQRRLEASFSGIYKPPDGISIRPYSGCPHWTISRNLLGLPRVGPYDTPWDQLPYTLLDRRPSSWEGHKIVEVHPALAVWLWIKDAGILDWRYKDREARKLHPGIRRQFLEKLGTVWKSTVPPSLLPSGAWESQLLSDTDLFDAYVAALLALIWTIDPTLVSVWGDRRQGAMLLPGARPCLDQSL